MGVFTVKELIHRKIAYFIKKGDPNAYIIKQLTQNQVLVNSVVGGAAGLAIQIMIYPFDYFRIILSN